MGPGAGTFSLLGHLLREFVTVGQQVAAGQRIGDSGNSGFSTGPHVHFAIMMDPNNAAATGIDFTAAFNGGRSVTPAAGKPGVDLPWWADKPIEFLRGAVNSVVGKIPMDGLFGDMLKAFPDKIFDGARDFLGNFIGASSDGYDNPQGGAIHTEHGTVPYNGAQMFDNGGYLAPGVTTVLNMTGKPEPVFTDEQWQRGSVAGAPLIGKYEPHFHDASMTSDDVAQDLTRTLQRVSLGGKFAGRTP
jgi:hypothetical protein